MSDGSVQSSPLPQDQGYVSSDVVNAAIRQATGVGVAPGKALPFTPDPGGPRVILDPIMGPGPNVILEPVFEPGSNVILEPEHEDRPGLIAEPVVEPLPNGIVDEFPEVGGGLSTVDLEGRGNRTWEEAASPGTKPGQDPDSKEIGRVADILKARGIAELGVGEYVVEINQKHKDSAGRVIGENDLLTRDFHIEKTTRGKALDEAISKSQARFSDPDKKSLLNPEGVTKLYIWVEEGVPDGTRQTLESMGVGVLTGPKESWVYTIPLR